MSCCRWKIAQHVLENWTTIFCALLNEKSFTIHLNLTPKSGQIETPPNHFTRKTNFDVTSDRARERERKKLQCIWTFVNLFFPSLPAERFVYLVKESNMGQVNRVMRKKCYLPRRKCCVVLCQLTVNACLLMSRKFMAPKCENSCEFVKRVLMMEISQDFSNFLIHECSVKSL